MFLDEKLQMLIEGKIIGDTFPYNAYDEQEILSRINRLFYRINRIHNVVCEAEWNHFGSGYASFVEFFCYWNEDCVVVEEKHGMREVEIKGIVIDISRLASVAVIGEDVRQRKIRIETNEEVSGGQSSILDGPNSLVVGEELETLAKELQKALQEFNYELMATEEISMPLSFQTKIPTIYLTSDRRLPLQGMNRA